MPALSVLAHHSEPSDPVLLRWVVDTFESIFGLAPLTVVVPIAVGVVVLPMLIGWFAWRARRGQAAGADDDGSEGLRAK